MSGEAVVASISHSTLTLLLCYCCWANYTFYFVTTREPDIAETSTKSTCRNRTLVLVSVRMKSLMLASLHHNHRHRRNHHHLVVDGPAPWANLEDQDHRMRFSHHQEEEIRKLYDHQEAMMTQTSGLQVQEEGTRRYPSSPPSTSRALKDQAFDGEIPVEGVMATPNYGLLGPMHRGVLTSP